MITEEEEGIIHLLENAMARFMTISENQLEQIEFAMQIRTTQRFIASRPTWRQMNQIDKL